MKETFGVRLQIARKRAGYKTQEQLAKKVGVSVKSIRNYEGDRYRPQITTLDELRRLLGNFDYEGDPVEAAVEASRLTEDRKLLVLHTYKRELREQDESGEAGHRMMRQQ